MYCQLFQKNAHTVLIGQLSKILGTRHFAVMNMLSAMRQKPVITTSAALHHGNIPTCTSKLTHFSPTPVHFNQILASILHIQQYVCSNSWMATFEPPVLSSSLVPSAAAACASQTCCSCALCKSLHVWHSPTTFPLLAVSSTDNKPHSSRTHCIPFGCPLNA